MNRTNSNVVPIPGKLYRVRNEFHQEGYPTKILSLWLYKNRLMTDSIDVHGKLPAGSIVMFIKWDDPLHRSKEFKVSQVIYLDVVGWLYEAIFEDLNPDE